MEMSIPQCTWGQYEDECAGRHLLHGVVSYWAERKPEAAAIVHHDRDVTDTWTSFDRASAGLSMQLLRLGFRKGDFFATSLPFLREHILLEYACFRIGVIHAPLDLRLSAADVVKCVARVGARGYCFLGQTRSADFRTLGRAVKENCPSVRQLIQMSPIEETIPEAIPFAVLAQRAQAPTSDLRGALLEATAAVGEEDGAQVIFTTGSTGSPKPALLSHRSITVQNMCIGAAFFREDSRVLVNLPPSHVGGQAELFMTTLFCGGTAVVLEIFDPVRSLDAIEQRRVTLIGQIPAMFTLEWRTAGYGERDLSSLETVVYGGQQVPEPFLEKLAQMAPAIGTGLGLTEASGFCTYTPRADSAAVLAASIGRDMPVYRMTIRGPMREGGSAGDVLPAGETGHVCFEGPQTFLGYVGASEATAKALSRDGVLYTGDMGYADEAGLHFSGRSSWVMKPRGYQVFPAEVEGHFAALSDQVAACGVVSVEHRIFSEGIVAFVEKKPGAELTIADLKRHARSMTGYTRPNHYVILEPGEMPLNRVAKTDYLKLMEMARAEVDGLRAARKWDRVAAD